MAEPAELLLIRDQYELAFHYLSRGQAAQEAGKRSEALEYYKKGRQHLNQGLGVPTGGERHQGAPWDAARQLQQKMSDTLRTVSAHLTDLETAELTTESQRSRVLMDLAPHLYPLASSTQPPHSSLLHLYPTVPATTIQIAPTPAAVRPAPPGASPIHRLSSEAPGTKVPSLPTLPLLELGIPGDQPPAYTPQPTDGHHSLAYSPAGGGLGLGEQTGGAAGGDGEELLFIPSGVQMFFVTPDGQVSSLFYPGYLRIIAFDNQSKDSPAGRPSAFLHVCDWLYPLTTDTPVLLANSGIFMFPDTTAATSGSYVGIVLSSELPNADREMFQDLLSQLTELRVQAPVEGGAGSEVINLSEKVPLGPPGEETGITVATGEKEKLPLPEWSEKMAQGILSGAMKFSQGFVKGAEATGRAIHKGASKLRDHITPENTPAEVSPRVTKGLQVAKQATGGAVRVSQFLVNGVSTVAGCVGEKLAPHVKKHGAKLIPESMKKSKDGRASNLDGAKLVAASSLQGLSAVWTGLETGAKNVGKSVASETVTTMKYNLSLFPGPSVSPAAKRLLVLGGGALALYGDEAGQATDSAVQSVINVGVAAYNIDHLGIKAMLKTTGKKTGKAMIKDHEMKNGQPAETQGEGEKEEDEQRRQ